VEREQEDGRWLCKKITMQVKHYTVRRRYMPIQGGRGAIRKKNGHQRKVAGLDKGITRAISEINTKTGREAAAYTDTKQKYASGKLR